MPKILIIDDEAAYRYMLKKNLENEGFQVVEAPDGKIGIDLYRTELPDLVITDIVMPEKDGIEVVTELKRDFPESKIIVISGGGNSKKAHLLLETVLTLGADNAVFKSVDNQSLLTSIKKLLEN